MTAKCIRLTSKGERITESISSHASFLEQVSQSLECEQPYVQYTWIDEETGYKCKMKRQMTMQTWCGYVILEHGHFLEEYTKEDREDWLYVHGGITFQNTIRHLNEKLAPQLVIGFDCSHAIDAMPPWTMASPSLMRGTYRTMKFVADECADLAKQIRDLKKTMMRELLLRQ
jgi:hypothetical protein